MFEKRMDRLRDEMARSNIDVALITDDDSVYYFCGYYDYLHMDFGRPTILVVEREGGSLLITPAMESDMADEAARVDRIAVWNDGAGNEWREELPNVLSNGRQIAIEREAMPSIVRRSIEQSQSGQNLLDIAPVVAKLRMIKSAEELKVARHAGEVANAMMNAGRGAIGDGVAEYEVALASSTAGTRKAAELLDAHYADAHMSPNTHFLQIMASGKQITKPHHRATTRVMRHGEPVFLCFCGMTNFHRFKLGFDRTFWIGEVQEDVQSKMYDVAVRSQAAALKVLGPGGGRKMFTPPMHGLSRKKAMPIRFGAAERQGTAFWKNRNWWLAIKPFCNPAWCWPLMARLVNRACSGRRSGIVLSLPKMAMNRSPNTQRRLRICLFRAI